MESNRYLIIYLIIILAIIYIIKYLNDFQCSVIKKENFAVTPVHKVTHSNSITGSLTKPSNIKDSICGDGKTNITNVPNVGNCIRKLWKESTNNECENGLISQSLSNDANINKTDWVKKNLTIDQIKSDMIKYKEAADKGNPDNIKGCGIKTKELNLTNQDDLLKILPNSTFRLKVNIPIMPPYIKGKEFKEDLTKENIFYLAIEELEPNCSINFNNKKTDIYVDNKFCENKGLSSKSSTNKYRCVLISAENIANKAVDFTLVKILDKYYLKNITTGYYPQLVVNDVINTVYGNIINKDPNNLQILQINNNELWNAKKKEDVKPIDKTYLSCQKNLDGKIYFMTSNQINNASPIKMKIIKNNNKNYINLILNTYNLYGVEDKSFILTYCNFNIKTGDFIEYSKDKKTNLLNTYNLVCIDDANNRLLKDKELNFSIEMQNHAN